MLGEANAIDRRLSYHICREEGASTPHRVTWGGTKVGGEAEGEEDSVAIMVSHNSLRLCSSVFNFFFLFLKLDHFKCAVSKFTNSFFYSKLILKPSNEFFISAPEFLCIILLSLY